MVNDCCAWCVRVVGEKLKRSGRWMCVHVCGDREMNTHAYVLHRGRWGEVCNNLLSSDNIVSVD